MARSNWVSRLVLDVLPFAIAVWCFLVPRPYGLSVLVCALTPWVGLALAFLSGGRVIFNGRDSERRPDAFNLVFLPALTTGARALMDFKIFDWQAALAAGAGVSLVWNIVILAARRGERPKGFVATTIILLLFGVDYGYGVATFADALGDERVVATYAPPITSAFRTARVPAMTWSSAPGAGGRMTSKPSQRRSTTPSRSETGCASRCIPAAWASGGMRSPVAGCAQAGDGRRDHCVVRAFSGRR